MRWFKRKERRVEERRVNIEMVAQAVRVLGGPLFMIYSLDEGETWITSNRKGDRRKDG